MWQHCFLSEVCGHCSAAHRAEDIKASRNVGGTTTDPKVAAGLVEQAADLKVAGRQGERAPGASYLAPDLEPPAAT
jgi:hypothetical protein